MKKKSLRLVHVHGCSCLCGCAAHKDCACQFPQYFNGLCLRCADGIHSGVNMDVTVGSNNGMESHLQ